MEEEGKIKRLCMLWKRFCISKWEKSPEIKGKRENFDYASKIGAFYNNRENKSKWRWTVSLSVSFARVLFKLYLSSAFSASRDCALLSSSFMPLCNSSCSPAYSFRWHGKVIMSLVKGSHSIANLERGSGFFLNN